MGEVSTRFGKYLEWQVTSYGARQLGGKLTNGLGAREREREEEERNE